MHPVPVTAAAGPWPLHDAAASRVVEQRALAGNPPQALMQRAGLAVAQLALAWAPHAQRVQVLAGPGNNGGDGFVAALHLQRAGKAVQVAFFGDAARLPADAAWAHAAAAAAGVPISPAWQGDAGDLAIDALLGLGTRRAPEGALADAIRRLNGGPAPVLSVDLPSGLHADTGVALGGVAVRAQATLSLLTLKPGLYTGQGRDHAGRVWLHTLGVQVGDGTALLAGPPPPLQRQHAAHKGSFGDVAVVGGAPGMTGAAWLAANAALAAGAGRVYVSPLDAGATTAPQRPELMTRSRWWLADDSALANTTVVCGCGGGTVVAEALPRLLARASRLVLDADGLNAVAAAPDLQAALRTRAAAGHATVLTPHPLEAARLLGCSAADVQADRLAAAQALVQRYTCVVVLKGSGSIVAAPRMLPRINPTGNALLATAGTGDVLAGWLGGLWAQQPDAPQAAAVAAVWQHGHVADRAAAAGRTRPLRALDLVELLAAG
ncbi:NAD(P)H-hydrate dehydratase [Rubrivivax sp. RP6-9]|uniref:NAD(P)H-hydrate dehydratase n=1 Tax=Rubrivivax sp. RP6-9 TaxID=3415750 RepID=UPI003CC5C324